MIAGMDFGTTNSGMAVYDGENVTILPLDPSNGNKRVAPTALYIMNDQTVHVGRTAVDQYFNQNIGRASKMQRVWVGEIEIIASEVYYVTDTYVWTDVLSPGRIFLSIKTGLRNEGYTGTIIGQHFYTLENLITLYLYVTKLRAEKLLGKPITQVVLGRPVHFAHDAEHDKLAQARLLTAAFDAGYEKVSFQYEPIAAAFSYETTLDSEQNVLIFDFGGGTLDITVMRLGDPVRRQVLATGGIPIAGDVFDQKLVRAKVPPHFGEGSFYGERNKRLNTPRWIYDAFSDWQSLLELQSASSKTKLRDIARTAQHKHQIEELISFVSGNYGLKLFDMMEKAKRRLSDKRGAEIHMRGDGFELRDFVTRTEFERIIQAEILDIDVHLDEIMAASGLQVADIDAVIRTGGSAQVPVFHEMLARKFGADKVKSIDAFSSVTAGLGIIAHELEQGRVDLPVYTRADAPPSPPPQSRVAPVNLDVLMRRLAVVEGATEAPTIRSARCTVCWGDGNVITVFDGTRSEVLGDAERQGGAFHAERGTSGGASGRWRGVREAGWDERLLLLTTSYRFLLITPRQLVELANVGLSFTDQYKLDKLESVAVVESWDELLRHPKLLLTTTLGVARVYVTAQLKTAVETPIPLKFDQPLLGAPLTAVGVSSADSFVLVTASGKGARMAVKGLRVAGTQVINCHNDRVTASTLVQAGDKLLLLTADGYARRLLSDWIPVPTKPNTKGKGLVARRSSIVAVINLRQNPSPQVVTSERVVPLKVLGLGLEVGTKTAVLLKLAAGEEIGTVM